MAAKQPGINLVQTLLLLEKSQLLSTGSYILFFHLYYCFARGNIAFCSYYVMLLK